MKKAIAIFVLWAMVFGLFGCAGGETPETSAPTETEPAAGEFMVGYGRGDITPTAAVPMAGYGNGGTRLSEKVLDPLYLTCVAFRQGEETFLLLSLDLLQPFEAAFAATRLRMVRKTGVPAERIMFCCTHTHSAPQLSATDSNTEMYFEAFQKAALKAAEDAMADLAPAKLLGTRTQVEDMNFVRHYLMNDGTYYGPNFGSTESGYKSHLRESDQEMLLVKADREGDKADILLMNWQAHPCFTGGADKREISADFIGVVRQTVETETGMLFAFFQGAGGDHNAISFIEGETRYPDNEGYGKQLAKEAIAALANLAPLAGSGVRSVKVMYEADVNHEDEALLEQAKQVAAFFKASGDRKQANHLAKQLGMTSVYHANAIVSRPDRPQKAAMEINAAYLGGLALVTAPFEMFGDSGSYIKENSPFAMTFVCTNANESYAYIPTREAYEYGCYESYSSYFAKGTAEAVTEEYLKLLKGLQ